MKNLTEILKGILVAMAIIALIVWTVSNMKKPADSKQVVNDTIPPPVITAGKVVANIGSCKLYELTLADNGGKIYVNICETVDGLTQSMIYKPQ